MISWQRNIIFIMAAQFFSLMGFSFAMPFVPFYLQDLGVRDQHELKLWISLFNFSAPLTLAIFSPIWGALGDRYGRRMMLLRANLGAVVILFLMGVAGSPGMLVALRLLQGIMTGTMTAAATMVSLHAPEKRCGFALGILSATVCSGSTSGAFIGGLFADLFGYRMAFFAGSGLALIGVLFVLFGTEDYVSKTRIAAENKQSLHFMPGNLGVAGYILLLVSLIGLVMFFDAPWLPLLVQDIHGSMRGASFLTGSLTATGGIAGFLAGPIIGRLADRVKPPTIGRLSAIGAGTMSMMYGLASNFPFLFCSRFCGAFFAGGLDPVFQIWLSRVTPENNRGFVFGWAASARAVGWMCSSLLSGAVAWMAGLRAIFFTAAALYFLLVPIITFAVKRIDAEDRD